MHLKTLYIKKNGLFIVKHLLVVRNTCSIFSRYTHRVAISDNRIIKVDNENVVFKWRDYKDKTKEKVMSLKPEEFIRRFSMHILPDRFVKIRHYGILGNRNKN